MCGGWANHHGFMPATGDRVKQFLAGKRKRYYREFWALRNVNLQLLRGEMLGVIGENGAGKSTLLHLICGTLHPSEGEVHTNGRLAAMLELGAGFSREFTGRENVMLNAAVLGLTQKQIADRFSSIAAFADIGRFMELPVKTYSSGMYARLAFAVCAHVDADILIVDEILAVGDAAFQQKCMRFLRRFCEHGTLLFVSHDSGTVARLCQRALWLEHGEVRGLGPAEEVCARYLQSKSSAREAAFQTTSAATLDTGPLLRDVRDGRVNRIAVSAFDTDAPWHGHGGASITDTGFYTPGGARLKEINAGEELELRITARAERHVARPILGFILRDHLGQTVLGDNSYYAYRDAPLAVLAGERFTATFRFQFPYLAMGVYTMAPSLNEGTQADHVQLHWIEDGLVLEVTQSPVQLGIVGASGAGHRHHPPAGRRSGRLKPPAPKISVCATWSQLIAAMDVSPARPIAAARVLSAQQFFDPFGDGLRIGRADKAAFAVLDKSRRLAAVAAGDDRLGGSEGFQSHQTQIFPPWQKQHCRRPGIEQRQFRLRHPSGEDDARIAPGQGAQPRLLLPGAGDHQLHGRRHMAHRRNRQLDPLPGMQPPRQEQMPERAFVQAHQRGRQMQHLGFQPVIGAQPLRHLLADAEQSRHILQRRSIERLDAAARVASPGGSKWMRRLEHVVPGAHRMHQVADMIGMPRGIGRRLGGNDAGIGREVEIMKTPIGLRGLGETMLPAFQRHQFRRHAGLVQTVQQARIKTLGAAHLALPATARIAMRGLPGAAICGAA